MRSLIPREFWDHGFRDLLSCLAVAPSRRKQDMVLHIHGLGDCVPVRTGRAALVAAIRSLKLPLGASIGAPLFCCPVVFQAIHTAGCRPRFIDIDPETYCLSAEDLAKKQSRMDAVIAVHMFGNLCDVMRLREQARGKPIIEDCAQALGSRLEGLMAGSLGDLSFFSFRSGKYISAGEGGAIYSNDPEMRDRVSRIVSEMSVPSPKEECRHAVRVHIKSRLRSKPLYGMIGHRLGQLWEKRMKASDDSPVVLGQIRMTDLLLIRKRLACLERWIDAQRGYADLLIRDLELGTGMLCHENPGTFYNRYHFPILFHSPEQRDFVASHLRTAHIDSIKYLSGVVETATRHYGYDGGCPAAERISERVLVVPSYHALRGGDVDYIANCVNNGWAEIKRRGGLTEP